MGAHEEYNQMAALFDAIEEGAAAGRVQRLSFQNSEGTVAGSLIMESFLIRFGVECAGRPYLDPTFSREVMPYASPLIKSLRGEEITPAESMLLTKLPLSVRRAVRAVTARALRRLASLCDLSRRPTVQTDLGSGVARGSIGILFSPSELMLAAGSSGPVHSGDAAASEYEMPPLTPKQRWLFEWQGDAPRCPWPVMTNWLSERKATSVVEMGQLCQRLLSRLPQPLPGPEGAKPTAALIMDGEHIYYIVNTERYVALVIYPSQRRERLLLAIESTSQRGKDLPVVVSL